MGFLGFGGGGGDTHLVVVTYEGPGHLRLNGNHVRGGARSKRNAAAHERTICWIELTPDGARRDQGLGPMAGRLGDGQAERLLRELPQTSACRAVLGDIAKGRDQASKWLTWGTPAEAPRGSVGHRA